MSDDDEFDVEYDQQAEQATLGGAILSPAVLDECRAIVQEQDFYPVHAAIWTEMCRMADSGVPVDPITLGERLDAAHVPYGGTPYLHTLISAVPVAANAPWYAKRVRDLAARRDMRRAAVTIVGIARNPELDAADRADQAGHALDAATVRETGTGPSSIADELPPFIDELENGDDITPVPTGLVDFDRLFAGGLRPGELTTVGARPGIGKTAYLVTVALKAAAHGTPVMFWSLEMSKKELMQRFVANVAGVSLHAILSRDLDQRDWDRIAKAYAKLSALPIYIEDNGYLKLNDLRGDLRQLRRRGEPAGLALLDYLQLMTSDRKTENRQIEVAELARGLKLMAKEFDVPVIAASQLNRGAEARQDKKPMLSDLRESGAVEQDSDAVVLLYREDAYAPQSPRAGEIDLIVAKHRNGPTGTITAAFQGHYSRVADMAPDVSR
jgi:replicative DNA helicase